MDEKHLRLEELKIAVDTRKFEIQLFWSRSLFFWGFISAAFIAYAALLDAKPKELPQLVAAFGFVCSVAWILVNLGSKYWQENWETKVNRLELDVFGEELFAKKEAVQRYKGAWLSARRFSVSKIAITMSYFTAGVWLLLLLSSIFPKFFKKWRWDDLCRIDATSIAILVIAIAFVVLMGIKGRSDGCVEVDRIGPSKKPNGKC